MGAEGDSMEVTSREEVNVNIRCTNGSTFSLKTCLESTVGEFKVLLAKNCNVPAEEQRLIHIGQILKDEQTLASYGLKQDHTVHMICGPVPAVSPPSEVPSNIQSTGTDIGGTGVAVTAGSQLPGLASGANGDAGAGLLGAGFLDFEQAQLTQIRNLISEMINTPAVQSVMHNREMMRSLTMTSPQLREITDRNPEVGHFLDDPGVLRQTMEAARNSELMREMTRNTDRALNNIESSPNLNAARMVLGNQSGSQARVRFNSSASESQTSSGTTFPNSSPLPNPWINAGLGTYNVSGTNPAGYVRPLSMAGFEGFGLPGMENMGMPDFTAVSQSVQNPVVSQLSRAQSTPDGEGQINIRRERVRNVLDGLRLIDSPNTPNVPPPEELYATQLSQLQEMGFCDTRENIIALRSTSGNVHAALGRLLRNIGQ